MKKTLVVLVMVIAVFGLTTGCATGRLDSLQSRVDHLEGYTDGLGQRVDAVQKEVANINNTMVTKSMLTALEKSLEKKADKSYVDQRVNKSASQKIVDRLAKIEDVVNYAHPNIKTDAINTFKSGNSYLSEKAKTYLDEIVKRVNKKEVAIKQIIGYSDLSPAGKGTTNQAIALHRAESVTQYLKEKGIDLSNVVICGADATDRYGYGRAGKQKNRRATVILEKLPAIPATTPTP